MYVKYKNSVKAIILYLQEWPQQPVSITNEKEGQWIRKLQKRADVNVRSLRWFLLAGTTLAGNEIVGI